MHLTSDHPADDVVVVRTFTVDGVPGVLWTPQVLAAPVPVVLLGHPGGLARMRPRLDARARAAVRRGLAAATIELPGGGDRPSWAGVDRARAELRRALEAGRRPGADVVDRLVLPLVDRAVPEWRATLDALLDLPEVAGPVGFSGGVISVGVRLAAVEPRVVAAGLFAGSWIPRAVLDDARRVTIPVHVLLQWDDADNDRRAALELFDAFASEQKTLLASTGGHTGVPASAGEHALDFLVRHLRP